MGGVGDPAAGFDRLRCRHCVSLFRICSDKRRRGCLRFAVLDALRCHTLGALPSPLWGGVGGGGSAILRRWCHRDLTAPPPSPTRGEGADRVFGLYDSCIGITSVRDRKSVV